MAAPVLDIQWQYFSAEAGGWIDCSEESTAALHANGNILRWREVGPWQRA